MAQQRIRVGAGAFRTRSRGYAIVGRFTCYVRTGRREAAEEVKRGIDTYAKHVCRRRRDGSQSFPLFVLFVLFGQAKRTL